MSLVTLKKIKVEIIKEYKIFKKILMGPKILILPGYLDFFPNGRQISGDTKHMIIQRNGVVEFETDFQQLAHVTNIFV